VIVAPNFPAGPAVSGRKTDAAACTARKQRQNALQRLVRQVLSKVDIHGPTAER
jgi:hypothetical protein